MPELPAIFFPQLFDEQADEPKKNEAPKKAQSHGTQFRGAQSRGAQSHGYSWQALQTLVEQIAREKLPSPGLPSLLSGAPLMDSAERAVLLILGDPRPASVARWAQTMHPHGLNTLVACTPDQLNTAVYLQATDAPILLGHGLILASRGTTGRPLVGMPLAELRHELTHSRQTLTRLAGYPVHTLIPTPTTLGRTTDGLVLAEAQRAGYRLILNPATRVTNLNPDATAPITHLNYRTTHPHDTPTHLTNWLLNHPLTRPKATLTHLLRHLTRLHPEL